MKAIRLVQIGQPLQLCDVPFPAPGIDDVLLRVKAAGICHSDAHYRAGRSSTGRLPLTPGHEVAGIIESLGTAVRGWKPGDRVCVHYLATCGTCSYCSSGTEQFCPSAQMIGKHRDGGYAEFLVMPAKSLCRLPVEIPFEIGAIMMCSSATALHALTKARFKPGESVAVFGLGGLGISAVQLARALGATEVFGIDIKPAKLDLAKALGAIPVDASRTDPVKTILGLTRGRGVDVSLELIGLPLTMRQALLTLAVKGRAALAGITEKAMEVYPYQELLNKEAEIIGVSDHLVSELPPLIELARQTKLDLKSAISRVIPLDANEINRTLDRLDSFGDEIRVVITP
ncbi:MAG TPA: zinc-binding dehydrogenase [Verrucomicrobiae bacterium]|nr:zinc-binding dehydrogenase [Verrucomicrobiae bacterium]